MRQISQPPAHDAMEGWHRAVLDDLPQRLALMVVEKAGSARRLAVHKAIGTLGVEPQHPVTHDLQPDTANPRRVRARAAVIDLRQRQKTPDLRDPRASLRNKGALKSGRSGIGAAMANLGKLFATLNQT